MRKWIPALIVVTAFLFAGCTPIERQAYNTAVAAKAFLDSEKRQHQECASPDGASLKTCQLITQAVGAKDSLISAIEVYCSGPQFENGGACQAPAKGTPAAQQAAAKLQAAINNYNQVAADLKQATGGKK